MQNIETLTKLFNFLRQSTTSLGFWYPIILVPIWQEVLFRYIPYKFFYLHSGNFWAIGIISNLIFASIHWYFGIWFTILAFFAGLVYWYVMVKYGLFAAIVIHALINLIDLALGLRNFLIK